MEYKEIIFDIVTGETTERQYTPEEIAEIEIAKQKMQEFLAKQEEASVKRRALLDKLGITEEEAKLLLS